LTWPQTESALSRSRPTDLLKKFLNKSPPRLGKDASKADLFTLAQLGFDLRRLGKTEMRQFLRLIGINIFDELEERFESPLLKGALSLDTCTDWPDRTAR